MKINSNPPGSGAPSANDSDPGEGKVSDSGKSTDAGKNTGSGKAPGTGKTFENVMEGKMPDASQNPILKGKGFQSQQDLAQVTSQQEGETSEEVATPKKGGAPFSEKLFKNTLPQTDKPVKSDLGAGTPASQGMPLSAYLEPASHSKPAETIQHPTMNIAEIEKMVDSVAVGVNASGEPQMKMDVHLDSLGPVNIEVTRTEHGLQIHFNAETERAGLQLGQNLPQLQEALAGKGLQINNIQLLVGNEPVAMNQLIDSPKTFSQERVNRKDRVQKATVDKAPKTVPRGR